MSRPEHDVHTPLQRLRVIADVHGEAEALLRAADVAPDRHLVLLGDLVDYGPESGRTLGIALDLIASGRATLVRSNHDDRLYRHLIGNPVTPSEMLTTTLASIAEAGGAALARRFVAAYQAAPLWLNVGHYVLAHGAVDPLMIGLDAPPADMPRRIRDRVRWLALYGEGRLAPGQERPIRTYDWVDQLPAGTTAIVGHDIRSTDAPLVVHGALGGRVFFLDTGCGKGGHLSTVNLPEEHIAP